MKAKQVWGAVGCIIGVAILKTIRQHQRKNNLIVIRILKD
jgi:hypothetical protein